MGWNATEDCGIDFFAVTISHRVQTAITPLTRHHTFGKPRDVTLWRRQTFTTAELSEMRNFAELQ